MSLPGHANSRRVDAPPRPGANRSVPPSAALPAGAIALSSGAILALGTDHHAWTSQPWLGAWGGALSACAVLAAGASIACLWCTGITRTSLAWMLAACMALGMWLGTHDARAWSSCRHSLGITHPDARTLVSLTATVVAAPEPARSSDRIMEPLAADRHAVRTTLGSITGPQGEAWPSHAILAARIAAEHTDLAIGDRVAVRGWVTPMQPPTNPGGYDMSRWARSRFVVGSIFIESNLLVTRVGSQPRPFELWRHRLVADLRSITRELAPGHGALCVAMTLGPTSASMDGIAADCQVTGMTHILALSGFNVGLLLALASRMLSLAPFWGTFRAAILVACAVLFMASASAGISADRAAIAAMVSSAAAGSARGIRAWHAASIVVIVIVVAMPAALLDIGFQLSVVVAAALAAWANRATVLAADWALRVVPGGAVHGSWRSRSRIVVEWALAATIAGTIAFMASTPIVLHHFGSITPMVVPGSIVAAPLSAAIVTLCTVALVVGGISHALASIMVLPAGWCAAAFEWLLRMLASSPDAAWSVEPIPGPACVGALVCVLLMFRRQPRSRRAPDHRWSMLWLAPPLIGLAWWSWPARFDLRITMLDVANGSAWVIEHGDSAVLVDGGSLDVPDVGARTIVPALRSLGIGRLAAISISHADLDHLNGIPSVIERLPACALLTTSCVIEGACPGTPSHRVLEAAARAGCVVLGIEAGDHVVIDRVTWVALHPHAAAAPFPRNESSLVWLIHVAGASLLLTGDIEQDGSRRVLEAIEREITPGAAMLMELPHHGSFRPGVASLIERLHPAWIGQSTGPARLVHDRWSWIDGSTRRSVTARDGAVRVTVVDGSIVVERWERGWTGVECQQGDKCGR